MTPPAGRSARNRRAGAAFLLAAILATAWPQGVRAQAPGDFDFYVLALSWSPSYCEAEGRSADPSQCGVTRPFAFVVHGLWPQFERGFPEFCQTDRSGPDRAAVDAMRDIVPSPSLVRHQWRKHGSCSGLSPRAYLAALRRARGRITVPTAFAGPVRQAIVAPDVVERAFRAENPGLAGNAIAVTCDGSRLREVRICLNRDDLSFRPCPDVDRRACRAARVRMPPAR